MIPRASAALLAAMLLALAAPAEGQQRGERQGQELSRQEMQVRIVQQFERRLARELRLDREQLEEVQAVVASMRDERRELFHRRRALQARIQRFTEEGRTNERMARTILAESRAIRAEEARIETEEEARLLEVLSPSQVLHFQVMRNELNERIRRLHAPSSDSVRRPPTRSGPRGSPSNG